MKKIFFILCLLLLTGCGQKEYSAQYFDIFDTYTTVQLYCSSQKEFDHISDGLHDELIRLHRLFDIYNNYDTANIKAVNDNAGIKPVKVDKELYDIVKEGISAYYETDGYINIAMGSVLDIWHEHREKALDDPENADIPSMEELKRAAEHTDINNILLNDDEMTIYIKDKEASIDLGAIAKGYAADKAREYLIQRGISAGLINLGGNVIGLADSKKPSWKIGVQKPEEGSTEFVYKLDIKNQSAVSSGNYQRFYVYHNNIYHHIIDKDTLMPASNNKSVTIVSNSSLEGDIYSTYLFILPYDKGVKIAEEKGFKAVWVDNNDKTRTQG